MTTQEFMQILPAYVGCNTKSDLQFKKGIIELLVLDNMSRLTYRKNFKLILRSLSQMTDEESTVLYEITNWAALFKSKNVDFQLKAVKDWKVVTKAINYLRSIGIDCDGLIEAGYAIKEGEV